MATKPTWVELNPSSGSGDGTVAVSASEHTGREAREGTLTWTAANCEDVERKVIQAGTPEYVDWMQDGRSVLKEGAVITLQGYSNSSKLTFTWGSGDMEIVMPSSYTANSVSTSNGSAISGDPGADAAYQFSITLDVPANTTTEAKSQQIIVTDNAGNTAVLTIDQELGDPYLRVEEGDINLGYEGTAVSVAVESNTNWTIS